MVHIINIGNASLYAPELDQAYQLRHRVFVEERGWECLRSANGRDIDQFDNGCAVHVLLIERDQVVGYSRLLPTTKPHLLTDVYPQLAQRPIPRGEEVFEWSRYCISREKRGDGIIGNTGSQLLYDVMGYALMEGITRLTMQTDPIWITRFLDFGLSVEALGLPQDFGGELAVALSIGISDTALAQCRRMLRVKSLHLQSRGTPRRAICRSVVA